MLLSDYYKESVHSENGVNYEVLEVGKNQRAKFTVRCIVCQTVSTVMASSVLSGRKPCLCSTRPGKTIERKLLRLLPILESRKMDLVSTSIGKAKDPLKVYCNVCDSFSVTTYNSLVLKRVGCKYCANNVRPTEQEFLKIIEEIGETSNFKVKDIFYDPKKVLRDIELYLICNKCDNSWVTKKASVCKGSSCPHCAYSGFNTALPAKLYILRVSSEDGILQGYKYGISCDVDRRLYEHRRDCRPLDINFELAYSWDYLSGLDAQLHERMIRKKFGSYFSQWELPSGFTETISVMDLGELVDFQTKQYKDLINGRYY